MAPPAGENAGRAPPAPGVAAAVARFTLGSLAALAVVVVGSFFALRSVAIREAERDTRERVQLEGRLVEAVGLMRACCQGRRRRDRRARSGRAA